MEDKMAAEAFECTRNYGWDSSLTFLDQMSDKFHHDNIYSLYNSVQNCQEANEEHNEKKKEVELVRSLEYPFGWYIGYHDSPASYVHDNDKLQDAESNQSWGENQAHPATTNKWMDGWMVG